MLNQLRVFCLMFGLVLSLMLLSGSKECRAQETKTPESKPLKNLILPGESFLLNGRTAFIFWPNGKQPNPNVQPETPQAWVLYSPTLPGYPDKHEKWMHQQFIEAGIAVAGIDVGESNGSPAGQKHFDALYQELTENRGFAKKPCLLGRSRGGLWASSWAIRNPEKVSGLAGIYPVFDLTTYPNLKRAAPAYGLTENELADSLDQHNPIAKIDVLANARVPVFIIHGDIDKVVPLRENSQTLLEVYQKSGAGGSVELVVEKGQGHNYFRGFFTCQKLVDFTIARAKSGAATPAPQK